MLFIDTSNPLEVKKWIQEYRICTGVTTNQKILLQDKNKDIKQVIEDLIKVSNKYPINVELTKTNCSDNDLVNEAAEYVDERKDQIIVKVPMWADGRGLRIAKRLQKIGIRTNITCCMDASQVILAALSGVDYVSLFFRRMVDFNVSTGFGTEEAYKVASNEIYCSSELLADMGLNTQLIVGSIRKKEDVTVALLNGADIVTVTPNILTEMLQHPKTDETIIEFDNAWAKLTTPEKLYPIHNHLETELCTEKCPNFRGKYT